jgi:hypothetical protein
MDYLIGGISDLEEKAGWQAEVPMVQAFTNVANFFYKFFLDW